MPFMRTFGVEEELLLVGERTGVPATAAPRILAWQTERGAPSLKAEIQQEMLEVVGPACSTVHELAEGIVHARVDADSSARAVGARALPLGRPAIA